MAGDFGSALDLLDLALAKARAVTTDERLDRYARMATEVRSRLGYLGETVLIALAGGTGVGKSSLLNALAGESVAPVGRVRPTTDHPLVSMPQTPEPGLLRLLDALGIDDRVGHSSTSPLAIVDLPDLDSIDIDHRLTVEHLVPLVDAIVWVFDPEKYADESIHERFLQPMAGYRDQFVFVLNQIDRLRPGELDRLTADLRDRLADDGIPEPTVFGTVAVSGHEIGIGPLERYIEARLEAKRLVVAKLAQDVRMAARGTADVVGVPTGFDARWEETRNRAVSILGEQFAGAGTVDVAERVGRRLAGWSFGTFGRRRRPPAPKHPAGVETAAAAITSTVNDLAFDTGGSFGKQLRERFDQEAVERRLHTVVSKVRDTDHGRPVPDPLRWWRLAALGQWLLMAVAGGAAVWWLVSGLRHRGWPAIVVIVAIVGAVGAASSARRSGTIAGRDAAHRYRQRIEQQLGEEIDARLGHELRATIRDRAEIAGTLTELSLEVAKIESTP
jgi:hypothetical protein